jgi:hypothetical protein
MDMMKDPKKAAMNRIGQCGLTLSQRFRSPVFCLALLLLFTSAAFGQLTTADILGTVTDATGAVVPNATVSLTNLGTNEKRTGQSNGSGDYSFTLVPVGHYSITVKAPRAVGPVRQDIGLFICEQSF